MPPLYAQDPFSAVHQALHARWLDLPMAAVSVATEGWVLALVALAVYSWIERDVPSVLGVFVPLALALLLGGAGAHLLRALSSAPRPVAQGGLAAWRVAPSAAALATACFAAYTAAAYGRRGALALSVVPLGALAAAHAAGGWAAGVALGWALGAALGVGAWGVALRVRPDGRLAAVRGTRRARRSKGAGAPARLDREAKLP